MTRNERHKRAIEKQMSDYLAEVKGIWKKAEDEDRPSTDEERLEAEDKLKAIEELKEQRAEVESALKIEQDVIATAESIGETKSALEPRSGEPARPKVPDTPADVLMKSEGFKRAKANGFAGDWTSGLVDIEAKATLVEGDNLFLEGGTPGAGAAAVPLDQRPGVLPILYQQNRVANMFAQGTTESNAINYVVESTATNAADVVAEAAAKPESTLALDNAQETVKKIATFLPVG